MLSVPGITIDEEISVACPPSIVLDAIRRYLRAQDDVVQLVIPVGPPERLRAVAVMTRVQMEHEPHPNKAFIARYDDRVVIRCSPLDDFGPSLDARFTIRPHGAGTQLCLKGKCRMPEASLDALIPGAAFDQRAASAMIRAWLETLKVVLENDFGTLLEFMGSKKLWQLAKTGRTASSAT